MSFPSCAEAGVVREVVLSDGRRAFSGGPALKQTQEYPVEFGVEVHRQWAEDSVEFVQQLQAKYVVTDVTDLTADLNPRWDLCELEGCLEDSGLN